MTVTAKFAVSLPRKTFDKLERQRTKLRRPRSAIVAEAIELWLAEQGPTDEDQRYVQGYLRHSERLEEIEAVATAAVQHWEPWE